MPLDVISGPGFGARSSGLPERSTRARDIVGGRSLAGEGGRKDGAMTTQPPRVDLLDPTYKANPYPTYAELRSEAPVYRAMLPDGRGVWLVTRYKDVVAVLKDERFVKDWRKAMTPEQLAQIPPIPEVMKLLSERMIATATQLY